MNNNFIPMSETAYFILLSLVEERHGYGTMQYVSELTGGRIKLGAGTLYGTLGKLEKSMLIVTTKEEEKRKYYIITDNGKIVLNREIERIKELYEKGMEVMQDGSK